MIRLGGGNKEMRQIAMAAQQRGWTVELTRGGHTKWSLQGVGSFFTSQTPSDYRVITQLKCLIRRFEKKRNP